MFDNPLLPPEPSANPLSSRFMNVSNYDNMELFLYQLINFALWFVGFIFLALLIYGGFLYLAGGASDNNTDKGKKVIVMAISGLILILVSYAIVNSVWVSLWSPI